MLRPAPRAIVESQLHSLKEIEVISEAHALRGCELPLQPSHGRLNSALWRLRLALQQASSDAGPPT